MKHFYIFAIASLLSMPAMGQKLVSKAPAHNGPRTGQRAVANLPGLGDIISSQPEGTVYSDLNHYFEGCYVSDDGYVYDYLGDGYVSDIVQGADGCLYIKNPFGFFNSDDQEVWVKVVKGEGNTYEVRMPQAVYENTDGEDPILYAWRYVKNGNDTYADFNAGSQVVTFELRNDSLVKVGDPKAFIGLGAADGYFYGYGDTVAIYNKVKDAVPVPADASKAIDYKIKYNDQTDASAGKDIKVVFEGDMVYFGGLDDSQPDLWFSGRIDGNRLRLTKWQYMGIDRKNATYGLGKPGHMYLYPFGWGYFTDGDGNEKYGLYEVEEPSMAYDADTKSFATDELTLAVNRGHNYYPYIYYSKPTISPASLAGVDGVADGADVVKVEYTDLSGRRVNPTASGVYIKITTTSAGERVAAKVAVR